MKMNNNTFLAIIWSWIFTMFILCLGSPDILDGLIKITNK